MSAARKRFTKYILANVGWAMLLLTSCSPKIYDFSSDIPVGVVAVKFSAFSITSPNSVSSLAIVGTSSSTITQVRVYSNSTCTTELVRGTSAAWNVGGLSVTASLNSTTSFYAKGYDSSGTAATECTFLSNFVHDDIAPSLPVVSVLSGGSYTLSSGYTSSTSVTLSLSATDSGSGLSQVYITNTAGCAVGGSWSTFSATSAWVLGQTDATATVYAKFRDAALNESSCVSGTIVHDSVAPTSPSLLINGGAVATATTGVTLSLSAAGSPYQMDVREVAGCTGTAVWQTYASSLAFTLTAGTGSRTVSAQYRDLAGNVSACTSATITLDATAPSIVIDSGAAYTTSTNVTLGLTAPGYTQMYITNTAGCAAGGAWAAFSASPAWVLASSNASNTVYVQYWDGAAAYSACLSSSIIHDNTVPAATSISIDAGATYTANSTVTLTLGATDSYPVEMYITNTAGCAAGGSWAPFAASSTWTLGQTQGTATVYVRYRDAAGNLSACINDTIIHDSVVPILSLIEPISGTALAGGAATNIVWNASDAASGFGGTPIKLEYSSDGGTTWTTIVAATANTSTYAWTTPAATNSDTFVVKITATDQSGLLSTATSTITVDSTAPQLTASSYTITQGATTTNRVVQLNFQATDNLAKVGYFCIVSNSTSAPSSGDSCWVSVAASPLTLTPATTLDVSSFSYSLSPVSGSYSLYVWAKDLAGNMSSLSNTGAGTDAQDKATIVFTQAAGPLVSPVTATNVNTPTSPPTVSELTVAAAGSVYVLWNATSTPGLATNPISVYYTTDESTSTLITSGLANGDNGCGSVPVGYTGCYLWSGANPSTYFRVRVSATDVNGTTSFGGGLPNNASPVNFLAGSPETGEGGSASTASFNADKAMNFADPQTLVAVPSGTMYYRDASRGVLKIDPATGLASIYIRTTGTSSGDGGLATSATLKFPIKIALDESNNLLIYDYNLIRKVNLTTGLISTLIGGGGATSDGTDALSFQIQNPFLNSSPLAYISTSGTVKQTLLFATPNGDIYFIGNTNISNVYWTSNLKINYYKKSDGKIYSVQLSGTGYSGDAAQALDNCGVLAIGANFDATTSQIKRYVASINRSSSSSGAGCTTPSTSGFTNFNATTGAAFTPYPSSGVFSGASPQGSFTSAAGDLYFFRLEGAYRYSSSTNAFTQILGTTTAGVCADGVAATSCNVNLSDYFVSSSGQVYFVDAGKIRTVDGSGLVRTLFGAGVDYGEGGLAVLARLGSVESIARRATGAISLYDSISNKLKEFTPSSTIFTFAGNGNDSVQANASDATAQPISRAGPKNIFIQDPATGDSFMTVSTGRVVRLTRGTPNVWSTVVGGGATSFVSGDGSNGTTISSTSAVPPNVTGWDGSKLLLWQRVSGNTDCSLKLYDSTSSYNQSNLTYNATCGTGSFSGATTSTSQTPIPFASRTFTAYWDSANTRWITISKNGSTSTSSLNFRAMIVGGAASNLATATQYPQGFTYRKVAATEYLYYCGLDGGLYKITVGTGETALTLPVPGMKCQGSSVIYDTVRGSLIFPYNFQGMSGIAEYINP